MKSIELTVIILTCHRAERCHDSLMKNQAALSQRSCEWLVVNNGDAGFALPPDLPAPARLLRMPENLGAAARNKALLQPQGRYILMLDDDAYIESATVDAALAEMQSHPDAGGVILPVDGEGCLLPTVFHGCAVLFAAEALKAIGGYPDQYLYYGEEYDVAFRLAAAGFSMRPELKNVPAVHHVRDGNGRNMNHILYRLVRNNAFCWARCLPPDEVLPALADSLHRYFYISRKENARAGFWRGVCAVPFALWRGFRMRSALNREQFNQIALLHELEKIRPDAPQKLVICGLGKFARSTLKRLRQNGWTIEAILEHNPAFQERHFCGVPVITPQELKFFIAEKTCILTGLVSVPVNKLWEEELTGHGWSAHPPESLVKLFRPHSPSAF